MTDYMSETAGNYYTQRWYIARRDQVQKRYVTTILLLTTIASSMEVNGRDLARVTPISLQAQLNKSKSWVIPSVALDGHVAE